MEKNSKVTNYAKWVVKRRWLVLVGSLVLAMLAGMGGQNIKFNNDYRVFFGDDNPQLNAFDALQDKYIKNDNVLIVLEPKNGDVFTKENLKAVEELTLASWQTPFSTRVDALTNYQHTYSVGDDMYVEDLASDMDSKTKADVEKIRKIALNEPLLVNRIVNDDATLTAVNITITLPGEAMNENQMVVDSVKTMVAAWQETYPDFTIRYSGLTVMNQTFTDVAMGDMSSLIPLMFLIIIIMVLIATRSATGMFASVFILFFSIMAAMGIAGWLGFELTGVTVSVPTMVMTLAIADTIHILVTVIQQMRKGLNRRDAIVESLKINMSPVFITSVTTAIGFLTLNLSDSPPFHDLGNMTAVGVMAAFFFSITFLPAFLAVLPMRVKQRDEQAIKGNSMNRFAEWVVGNRTKVLIGSTLFTFAIAGFSVLNQINNDFVGFFSEDVPFRRDADFVSENLTGIFTLEFSLGSGESDGISEPEYQKKLQAFEKWWYEQDYVIHVNSFHEIPMRTNRSMHGDSTQYYVVPNSREEAAQYLLLYEMSLPYGLDLNNQINVDKSETRFVVTVENITSNQLIAMSEAGEKWLKENAPEYMFAYAVSPGLMFSHLGVRQANSMISGTGLALLLISLVLIFALRSLKFGLISLIPNVAPLAVGFGIWGLVDGMVHTGITVVFGMTLGIIVDDTVHFLSKYIRARRDMGKSTEDAVRYAFATVGRAILVTTIVLVSGFVILAQSNFAMNSGMGQLTAIIVVVALVIDFLLLPTLLLALDRKKINLQPAEQTEAVEEKATVEA